MGFLFLKSVANIKIFSLITHFLKKNIDSCQKNSFTVRILYLCARNSKNAFKMIQRIQSVFLFLAAVASGLLFLFPIAWFRDFTVKLYVTHVQDFVPGSELVFNKLMLLPLTLLAVIVVVLPILILFMYKNLSGQLRLIRLCILFDLVLIGLIFFYYVALIEAVTVSEATYDKGIFLPLIALVFLFLALRGVRKDIKLIRSADRLR